MTTLDSPQLQPQAPATSSTGLTGWLQDNKWWLMIAFAIGLACVIYYIILNSTTRTKRLQRDALVKLRKNLIESCKATRGPAKTVSLTGTASDPPIRLGRYVGHHRSVEACWIAYRTWLFGKTRLLCANPTDVGTFDGIEITIRSIGIHHARDIGFAVPDNYDERQRAEWQRVAARPITSPEAFAEAWKAYLARSIDNALAVFDSLNAAEDRSFLRQEVTRTPNEQTETLTVPTKPTSETADTPEANA